MTHANDHRHTHDHDHGDHHHGHRHPAPASFGLAFAVGIGLNTAYVMTEAVYGVLGNSLALLADAGHNFGDILGLVAAWLAAWMGRKAPSPRYTYGLRGSSILAALSNATLLLVVTGGIAWEAISRLTHPEPAAGVTIMIVAAAGMAVNGLTALMFAAGRKGDLNIRAAFGHMMADALVAAGVVAAGAAILVTGWAVIDPIVSLLIGVIIVVGTWTLLRESLDLALHAVPVGVDQQAVKGYLATLPGVSEVHDLHIWGMSTTETALTAHLVRPEGAIDDALLHRACAELRMRFSVHHATLQIEKGEDGHPCELAPEGVV
ncbi:MAG TPA: cation diffusion facilitator family transporter [Caulobacteraceae bacterium]|nr:cation diffusion facilitator family transporter [Caulobacteraceae bacterium]